MARAAAHKTGIDHQVDARTLSAFMPSEEIISRQIAIYSKNTLILSPCLRLLDVWRSKNGQTAFPLVAVLE
jgi:hypothetical protein